MKRNALRAVVLSFFILLLVGCGGSNESTAVRYEGSTLIVDNVSYERNADVAPCPTNSEAVCPTSRTAYKQGDVIIQFGNDSGREKQVESEIARLGLTVKEKTSSTFIALVIDVPHLYEEQWVNALSRNSLYDKGVFLNQLTSAF